MATDAFRSRPHSIGATFPKLAQERQHKKRGAPVARHVLNPPLVEWPGRASKSQWATLATAGASIETVRVGHAERWS